MKVLFDFGMRVAVSFGPIAFYGQIWVVRFRDEDLRLVIEDDPLLSRKNREGNFVLETNEFSEDGQ